MGKAPERDRGGLGFQGAGAGAARAAEDAGDPSGKGGEQSCTAELHLVLLIFQDLPGVYA